MRLTESSSSRTQWHKHNKFPAQNGTRFHRTNQPETCHARYDAFGNALGFNAATALTTYLYSSMPYDAASGNHYDHARFYDSSTGEFTQSDYGYAGSLANPMTDLPYAFTGGDPINMLDLSGNGFSLPDVIVAMGIISTLGGPSIGGFGAATGGSLLPDAAIFGFRITLDRQQFARFGSNVALALAGVGDVSPISMVLSELAGFLGTLNSEIAGLVGGSASAGVTAGLELIADRKDEVLGVYGFVGAAVGVSAGSGNVSTSIYDGVVWDVPKWTDYAGPFITVGGTVSPGMLGAGVNYFYAVGNPSQHGILTSLSQGAGSGLGGSYTKYRALDEVGQGPGAVLPWLELSWPPPYDFLMPLNLG